MITKQFDEYVLYHIQEKDNDVKLIVNCYMASHKVGIIEFREGEIQEAEVLADGELQLYFGADRIREIIETLRYEKPLFLQAVNGKSMVSTIREPVGEEENHHGK